MRKFLFNGAVIGAAFSAIGVINQTRTGPGAQHRIQSGQQKAFAGPRLAGHDVQSRPGTHPQLLNDSKIFDFKFEQHDDIINTTHLYCKYIFSPAESALDFF